MYKPRTPFKGQAFRKVFVSFSIAVSSMLPLYANAFTLAEPVEILETFDASTGQGEYTVTNNSGEGIFALFVGNNLATQADKSDNPVLNSWNSRIISRDVWESGEIPFPLDGPISARGDGFDPIGAVGDTWTPPDTTALSWVSIFGSGYTQAVGYWSDGFGETPQAPIASGATEGGFLFSSLLPASPFVTFGNNGIAGQGNTTVVPVPSAILLFGSGLLSFAGWKRKG